jgi:hypothetical protein
LDHIAISEQHARDALTIDERPALTQAILDIPCLLVLFPGYAGVAFADRCIVDADRAVWISANPDT